MRYSSSVNELIREAAREARELGHSFVGSIHILLALSQGTDGAGNVLRGCGAQPETLRQLIMLLFQCGTPGLP